MIQVQNKNLLMTHNNTYIIIILINLTAINA